MFDKKDIYKVIWAIGFWRWFFTERIKENEQIKKEMDKLN